MCKSICGGKCLHALHEYNIDCKDRLAELMNALNNITICSINKSDTDNKYRVSKINDLKTEVKSLLDEVTWYEQQLQPATCVADSPYKLENAFEEFSFKEKVKLLKEKLRFLETSIQKK